MKFYTTKANAKRAAEKAISKIGGHLVESAIYAEQNKGDGFNAFITLTPESTPASMEQLRASYPNFHFDLRTEEKEEAPKKVAAVSTASNPCELTWSIAEEMVGSARKDILTACVKQGIAYNTARTQYQAWRKANKA